MAVGLSYDGSRWFQHQRLPRCDSPTTTTRKPLVNLRQGASYYFMKIVFFLKHIHIIKLLFLYLHTNNVDFKVEITNKAEKNHSFM